MRRCHSLNKPGAQTDLTGPKSECENTNLERAQSLRLVNPIEELHMALGRGEPGSRPGTVKRWIDFKNMIRIRQLSIEAERVRKRLTYKKSTTGVEDVESEDSYYKYQRTLPQKGYDERKTRSLMSAGSYQRLTGVKIGDFNRQDLLAQSSSSEDDFDRDYKISKNDRRQEQIRKDKLTDHFKQMIFILVEGCFKVVENNKVQREKQRKIDLKENEKLKYQASKTGIIEKFRKELSPDQYQGLLGRTFTILEPVKPVTEFAVPIDASRYKYHDWRTIYQQKSDQTGRPALSTIKQGKIVQNSLISTRNNFSTIMSSPSESVNRKVRLFGQSTQVSIASTAQSPIMQVRAKLKRTTKQRPTTAMPIKQVNF